MTVTQQLTSQLNTLQAIATDCNAGVSPAVDVSKTYGYGTSGGSSTTLNPEKKEAMLFSGMSGSSDCDRAMDEIRLISGQIVDLNNRVDPKVLTLNTALDLQIWDVTKNSISTQLTNRDGSNGSSSGGLTTNAAASLEKGLGDLLSALTLGTGQQNLTAGGTGSEKKNETDDTVTYIVIGAIALALVGIMVMLIK